MRLLLVRHGQTSANVQLRLNGWTDDPLDEAGEAQARAVARKIAAEGPVSAVYASPLQRARRTAEVIAEALGGPPVQLTPGLRERYFGAFENMIITEIPFQYPQEAELWAERGSLDYGPPGGEYPHEFLGRVMPALRDIVARHADDERVLVVTHGGVIALALGAWLLGDPTRWRDFYVRNCSVTELAVHSAPTLVRFNEVAEETADQTM